MTQKEFLIVIKNISKRDTSFDSNSWKVENPLWGHCAVVSLLAQEIFGGELIKATLLDYPKYSFVKSHIWNRIEGKDIDFTSEQYSDISFKDLKGTLYSREQALSDPNTVKRFQLLKTRFLNTPKR